MHHLAPADAPLAAAEPAVSPAVAAPGLAPTVADQERERVLAALGPAPVDIDELVRATGLPVRTLQIALIELALAGRIERHGQHLVSLAASPEGPDPFP
jgi:DNA processing protein